MDRSKQYELIFLLRAQMDASMKQFSLVGGQIQELEEKIQRYNHTLKDIDAYRRQTGAAAACEQQLLRQEAAMAEVTRKFSEATAAVKTSEQAYRQHQSAIAGLTAKIDGFKAREKELSAAMKQEGADTKALARQKAESAAQRARYQETLNREKQALKETERQLRANKDAEKELLDQKNRDQAAKDRLQEKLARERKKLAELSEALKQAGVDTKNLEAAEEALAKQIRETTDAQERLAEFANRVNDLADRFTVLDMAARGVRRSLEPAMDFFRESLDAASKLEYGMSAVQAVSGATRNETEQLTAVVKEMGATTVYTAEQCAVAMQNMALAGWDVRQMISGLPAVIKLAAASGEDLAEMTSIVSDGMNAFQLSGEKAAVKFADVLAKAATSSNTNVSLLGQSLSYVETTAGNLGYSIEDVSLALAAMANNALKGGVSGSALNTILTRMSGANEVAAGQMEKMGLSMYYTTDAMGHAAGEAKDLKSFLDELRGAFREFGDDAQAAQVAAYNLAGMRGMRGLMAIVNQSDAQWQKLSGEIYNYAGAADRISGVRMDNYTGQMYLLTSAWDALETSVGKQFVPTATDALGVLTALTDRANDFVQNHGGIVRGITGTVLALSGMLTVMTALSLAVQAFRFSMKTLEITKLISLGTAFGWIAGIAAAAGAAVALFTSNTDDGVQPVKELTEAARGMDKALEEAKGIYEDTASELLAAANVAETYIDRLEELGDCACLSAEGQREYQNTLALLLQVMPELSGSISRTTDEYGRTAYALETSTQALRANTEAVRENAMEQARQEMYGDLYGEYAKVLVEAEKNSIGLTQAEYALEAANQKYNETLGRMNALWTEAGEKAEEQSRNYGTNADAAAFLTQEYYDLEKILSETNDERWAEEQNIKNHQKAMEEDGRAVEKAKTEMNLLEKAIGEVSGAFGLGAQEEELPDRWSGVFEKTEAGLEQLKKAYTEVYQEAYDTFSGIFGLYDRVEEKKSFTTAELTDALRSQAEYFAEYRSNLTAVAEAAKENGIDLSGMWGRLADGSQESAAAMAAIAESVKGGDANALKEYAGQFSRLQENMEGLSDFAARESEKFKDAVEKAGADIAEAVSSTEAYDEAYSAMETTIQGYLDALSGKGNGAGRVNTAIAAAADRWKAAILDGYSSGTVLYADSNRTDRFTPIHAYPGFAGGTDYAPRGLALVGERGPELVQLSGGERIIPADRTARILGNSVNTLTVNEGTGFGGVMELHMKFEVSGNASPETVLALRDYAGEIKELVRSVLREERIDAKRRAFS